ncbi:MAG TPA: DUF1643 domain-containing protein [Amycolatopsis sp.]|nr:DUF1643 domain-containing protein [Amycolatopsis sp.]
MTLFADDGARSAVLSDDGVYRYHLSRTWDARSPRLAWLMLNPSTADALVDDPTIRRCMRFARDWMFGGIEVVNLFAYRATKPAELERCPVDVVGPDNYEWIRQTAERCPVFVLAWGAHKQATPLVVGNALAAIGTRSKLYQLGSTASGAPRHPLYVKANVVALPYGQEVRNAG